MSLQSPSAADIACIFPGAQFIVGGCTLLSNAYKAANDLYNAYEQNAWKGDERHFQYRDKIQHPQERERFDKQRILTLPGYQFERHALYMGIGKIRMIPIIGTLFSIARCLGYLHFTQQPKDPRYRAPASQVLLEDTRQRNSRPPENTAEPKNAKPSCFASLFDYLKNLCGTAEVDNENPPQANERESNVLLGLQKAEEEQIAELKKLMGG